MSPGYLAAPGIGNANGILLSFKSDNGRIGTSNWRLFVSRGIVTDHGGRIEIESEEGKWYHRPNLSSGGLDRVESLYVHIAIAG